jgi:PIN domain nuclease of toxin-antitoxin system
MRLLLDTHVAIWALVAPERLAKAAQALIADPENEVFVSAASIWEIAVKHRLGKLSAPPFSGTDAIGYFRAAGYRLLAVNAEHAAATESLPPHHADPFDRLLVAQAQGEPLRLVTHDTKLAAYGELILTF